MKIKICGITTPAVMQFCFDAHIDFVGCVFVEKSPRYICPDAAKQLLRAIKKPVNTHTKTVGLFQDASLQHITQIAAHTNIDCIQLHGSERIHFINAVKTQTQKPVIKAFAIEKPTDFDNAIAYDTLCDMLLFDAPPPEQSPLKGGHGVAFDWNMLKTMPNFNSPWFLAGGITPKNAAIALSIPHVQMLDVSGGVEKAKGIKDIDKIQHLINTVKPV